MAQIMVLPLVEKHAHPSYKSFMAWKRFLHIGVHPSGGIIPFGYIKLLKYILFRNNTTTTLNCEETI
jgi:hypothetical protein